MAAQVVVLLEQSQVGERPQQDGEHGEKTSLVKRQRESGGRSGSGGGKGEGAVDALVGEDAAGEPVADEPVVDGDVGADTVREVLQKAFQGVGGHGVLVMWKITDLWRGCRP
jgi:hypothetical protein